MKKTILTMMILLVSLQIGCKSELEREIVEIAEPQDVSIEVTSEDKIIIGRSEDISDYIVELFGVDDAAAIIFNDTALIGVVMAYDSELTDDTRELVSDIVMEKDTAIKQVSISSDEKIFNEIVHIINDLMNGKSYDNYVSSISKMIEKTNKKH